MSVSVKPFERIRERIRTPLRGQFGRGQIQIGKGALIGKAKEKATNVVKKTKELRPGILPNASKKLSVWYPGKRVAGILASKPQLKLTTDFTTSAPKIPEVKHEKTWIHY